MEWNSKVPKRLGLPALAPRLQAQSAFRLALAQGEGGIIKELGHIDGRVLGGAVKAKG